MTDVFFPNSRHTDRLEPSTGAVSESFEIINAAEIKAVHFSFSSVPSSENVNISVKNSSGNVVRYDEFDASESGLTEVTRAYLQWTTEGDGGTVEVSFPNTGNVCDSISVTYEYEQGK